MHLCIAAYKVNVVSGNDLSIIIHCGMAINCMIVVWYKLSLVSTVRAAVCVPSCKVSQKGSGYVLFMHRQNPTCTLRAFAQNFFRRVL